MPFRFSSAEGSNPFTLSIVIGIAVLLLFASLVYDHFKKERMTDGMRAKALARCLADHPAPFCDDRLSERHDPCVYRTYDPGGHRGVESFDTRAYLLCIEYGPDDFRDIAKEDGR